MITFIIHVGLDSARSVPIFFCNNNNSFLGIITTAQFLNCQNTWFKPQIQSPKINRNKITPRKEERVKRCVKKDLKDQPDSPPHQVHRQARSRRVLILPRRIARLIIFWTFGMSGGLLTSLRVIGMYLYLIRKGSIANWWLGRVVREGILFRSARVCLMSLGTLGHWRMQYWWFDTARRCVRAGQTTSHRRY